MKIIVPLAAVLTVLVLLSVALNDPAAAATAGLALGALVVTALWVHESHKILSEGTQAERVALNDVRTHGDPQDRTAVLEALQRAVDRAVVDELEASKQRHPSGGAA